MGETWLRPSPKVERAETRGSRCYFEPIDNIHLYVGDAGRKLLEVWVCTAGHHIHGRPASYMIHFI
jgi:hypothetical protein